MHILLIQKLFVGFMVSEIPIIRALSVFGYFPLQKDYNVFLRNKSSIDNN